jgi:hypothetical protein
LGAVFFKIIAVGIGRRRLGRGLILGRLLSTRILEKLGVGKSVELRMARWSIGLYHTGKDAVLKDCRSDMGATDMRAVIDGGLVGLEISIDKIERVHRVMIVIFVLESRSEN